MTPIDPVDVPDGITLERNRDRPHAVELAARWVCVTALAALVLAALLNVFGQRHVDTVAKGNGARLELSAPGALRSGLYFQGRFRVSAERAIRAPTLVLGGGWFDAITVNTVQPDPVETTSEGERIALRFSPLPAGRTMTVYVELQVNPTTFGRRDQGVELRDGDEPLTAIGRTVTIFP